MRSDAPATPTAGRPLAGLGLTLVIATVLIGFAVTAFVTQRASRRVESLSETIVSNSAPSIERLAELRALVFEVELMASDLLHDRPGAPNAQDIDAALEHLHEAVRSYLELGQLPGEYPYWAEVQRASIHFDDSVQETVGLASDAGREAEAQRAFEQLVEPAGRQLVGASLSAVEFHARTSRALASSIREARVHAIRVMNALSAVSIGLGLVGAYLLVRQVRRQRELVEERAKFHEARADELEQFAGRVAHDVRNPISAAKLASEIALRRRPGPEAAVLLGRVQQSLARADAITSALLDFARSGARPDPGARTDPAEVLADVANGVAPEAERMGIELEVEPVPPVLVACSTGVYLSLAGNLVKNAMKYMGERPVRRITIRVRDDGAAVRTEVVDTGPGIPAKSAEALFQPYFRLTPDRGAEGLGLGLATVKKLAEGHGGRVGVTSELGRGSTFWFSLPRAGSRWEIEADGREEPLVQH